jgi:hypothetical protein
MGLSMVYGFVKQSGGLVRIYSEVDKGTTISLYLPFWKDTEQTIRSKKPIKRIPMSGKVLLVDDEVDLLEIAAIYLKEMGFDVMHATDGNSALEIFENTPDIKLLVTDIVMLGGINGFQSLSQLYPVTMLCCITRISVKHTTTSNGPYGIFWQYC